MKRKMFFVGGENLFSFVLNREEFFEMSEHGIGLCLDCGFEMGCTNEDAEYYDCLLCKKQNTFGVRALLKTGNVRIVA